MIKTSVVSPLELHLDAKNPRFRVITNPTQADIRDIMLDQEDALRLTRKIVDMNTMLPGERLIVCEEAGEKIVLEGNRRTVAYQVLLDRTLIPERFKTRIPQASQELLEELKSIPIDIENDRKTAMAYLAARHIEGVKDWSSYSQWRFAYELYQEGKPIEQIADQLALSKGNIKKFIKSYKLLLRVIENEQWTEQEKAIINPLKIKPDKLLRLFFIRATIHRLNIFYDDNFVAHSKLMSDDQFSELIYQLARKAYISNEIDTRTKYEDIERFVDTYIDPQMSQKETPSQGNESLAGKENNHSDYKDNDHSTSSHGSDGSSQNSSTQSKKTHAPLPYFFEGLLVSHLNPNDKHTHGVSRICNELIKFSEKRIVSQYPVAACFLTRAIIEHALIYYARKHTILGSNKLIFEHLSTNAGKPKPLNQIIEKYRDNLNTYIIDTNVQEYFRELFSEDTDKTKRLNWVIHRPEEYIIDPSYLCVLPSSGLLHIINYLLA